METLVCVSVEEWLNRLADERESEGGILYACDRKQRQIGFRVANRCTMIALNTIQDGSEWWASEETRDETWARLGIPEIMFTEMCRRPSMRQLFMEIVARGVPPLYHCRTVGEWVNSISPFFELVDTPRCYGCKDPGTGITYHLPKVVALDFHSWFDTVDERDRLLRRKCMPMGFIANLLRFPAERAKFFRGPVPV